MKKRLCVVAMMAVLMLWGCTPDEKKGEAPVPKRAPTAVQVKDKAIEATRVAKEKLKEATKEVVEATKAVEEKVEEKIGQKAEQKAAVAVQEEKVEEATKAVDAAVEEKVEKEAVVAVQEEKVEEATKAVDEAVEKKVEQEAVVAVHEEKVETAEKVEKKAASVVEKEGQAATTTVESVVIDNKKGKVVLSHKKHAEAYGCTACHGDQKPGPFKMEKDKAHALCQGCHKEKKAGPTTNCAECHQKTDKKAIEGC